MHEQSSKIFASVNRLGRPVQFKFTLTHTKGILDTFRKNNPVFSIKFHYKPSSQFSKLQHTERTTFGPGSFLNIEYNSTSKYQPSFSFKITTQSKPQNIERNSAILLNIVRKSFDFFLSHPLLLPPFRFEFLGGHLFPFHIGLCKFYSFFM